MKHIDTFIIFDSGGVSLRPQWQHAWGTYIRCIEEMDNPEGSGKFFLRERSLKLNAKGTHTNQFWRNGVSPIKTQFRSRIASQWKAERNLNLDDYLRELGKKSPIESYPSRENLSKLNTGFGPFDFWYKTEDGLRCVIEWETGNISSSHRSMNKLCLALLAGIVDIAVLIVPSAPMYKHLTDRVGNWHELQPYLAFWKMVGQGVEQGLLAVTVVEHDELTTDPKVPYIAAGPDGRSSEGQTKLL